LVGKTAQIKELPERMAFGAFMAIFRSRCSDFAEVYLNSPEFRKSLEGVSTTTINQITQANLKNSLLPLPSLAEQRRIVAKVDQLMALCDELERKQNEKNVLRVAFNDSALTHLIEAKEPKQFALHWNRIKDNFDMLYDTPETVGKLRQTILQLAVQGKLVPQDPNDEPASVLLEKIRKEKERLIAEKKIKKSDPLPTIKAEEYPYELPKGWEWCRIDDIALTLSTGPFGTMLHKSDYVHDGVPLINPMNIVDGKIFPSIQKSVSNATKKRLSSYILEEGDVVIARRGEMGRCAAVTEKESGWLCGTGSFFIRLGNGIDREYFTKYFGSPSAMQYLMESSIGSTMNNLNHRIVGNMLCPLSPLAEQSRIVSKFEELMALCDEMEKQLAAAEEVNGALLESVVWRVGKG
jgi:type I restriction enzyme S subunit